jgi:peroxiredoxin
MRPSLSGTLLLFATLAVGSSVAHATEPEDLDALSRIAEATQLGLYVGNGLLYSAIVDAESEQNHWYIAGFGDDNVYPGTADFLEGSLVRFRDAGTGQIIDSPLVGFDWSSSPWVFDHVEDIELAGFKHIIKQNRFERQLNWSFHHPGFVNHSVVTGDLRLHAPHSDVRLKDLTLSASFENVAGLPFVNDGAYSYEVTYKNGPRHYSAQVDVAAGRLLGANAASRDVWHTVVERDGAAIGTILVDLRTLRAWAFDSDGHVAARLPGAPLGAGSFGGDEPGNNEPPPGSTGGFEEISGLAPDFTLPDANGNLVSLSDPEFDDKIVFLNFCAAWCTPCREEFPELRALQAAYGPQGVQVITVGVFEPEEQTYPLAQNFGFNFPLLAAGDAPSIVADYGNINAIPTTYLLDRDHNVVRALIGSREKENFEATLLAMGLEYSATAPPPFTDGDGDGWAAEYGDCDDSDASVNPSSGNDYAGAGADGIDQDCSGVADDGQFLTDGDGDGWAAELGDCDDSNASIYPEALEVAGNGIDEDCSGWDEMATCNDQGPRDSLGVDGTLSCFTTDHVWDVYIVEVEAGDCIDIHTDNSTYGAADLLGFAVDNEVVARSGLAPDFSELEDEWDCSNQAWNGWGCPSRTLVAPTSGAFYVGVAQWGRAGQGCTQGAGYTLWTSVNGVPVAPSTLFDDSVINFQ